MATSSFSDWTLEGIKNPLQLQSLILNEFENSTDGKYAVVDGNNVASFLIEGFSTIASKAIQKIDDTVLPAIYPSRAQSVTDLYKHLSDYDYLGLFAAPSSCSIIMVVDKGYLMRHAVDVVNSDGSVLYKKVVIPKSTRFTIGSYTFGLYYPIEIRVSSQTGMFTVIYDNSVSNPLHVLSQNILEYSFRQHDGLTLAYIKIPVYQFNTESTTEPLIAGSGYRRTIPYTDQFYALRCTAEVRDTETDTWSSQELSLALSGRTYDTETPTVVFTVDPDNKQCIVEIPYVYFTQNLIRGNIKVDIYTTAGYLNYQVPTNTDELVAIDMFGLELSSEEQTYAEPFRTMPALAAIPVTMQITGGTDGMSYADLRRKVVNNAFGDVTLQTPADVDAYFTNEGYVTSLAKDGITDRIFNAHAVLRNDDDSIIAAASISTLIDLDTLKKNNTKTIINASTDVYTILPSTRYRFDADKGICVPLTDVELDTLNSLGAMSKVQKFNSNVYTLSPFHLQISIKDKYPSTATYDMTDSEIESREFLTARDVSEHMSLNSSALTVIPVDAADDENHVTDKYQFTFKVIRSGLDDIEAVVSKGSQLGVKKMRVIVGLKKLDGDYVFAEATYASRTSDVDTYVLTVSTTATFSQIDGQHAVRVKSPFSDVGVDVYLTTEMRVILCLEDEVEDIANHYRTDEHAYRYLDTDFTTADIDDIGAYVALSEHRINFRFGKLINELDQHISLTYSGAEYETYDTTEFLLLEEPKFELDSSGVPTWHWEDDNGETFANPGNFAAVHVVMNEEYPEGTLKCFTNFSEESVVISRHLASNLAGCEWIDPYNSTDSDGNTIWQKTTLLPTKLDSDGFWDLDSETADYSGKDIAQKLEGVETTVMAHIAPRFSITGAQVILSGDSPILGTYEMANAGSSTHGALSTSADKWYRAVAETSTSGRTVYTWCVEAVDALKFIIQDILTESYNARTDTYTASSKHVFDGSARSVGEDAVAKLVTSYSEGMFVLIENDASSYEPPVKYMSKGNEALNRYAKLYLRRDGQWHCLLGTDSYQYLVWYVLNMQAGYVRAPESKYLAGRTYYSAAGTGTPTVMEAGTDYQIGDTIADSVEVYILKPYSYGYVYKCSRIEVGTYIKSDETWSFSTSWTNAETEVQYISFMNVDSDGLPDFTGAFTRTEDDTGTILADDIVWKNKVNKWPWEAETWYRLDKSSVTGGRVYKEDEEFASSFDSSRLAKYCSHTSGQVKLVNGLPVEKEGYERQVQYLVNMLQIDAKLAETTAVKKSHDYPTNIVKTMRTHFENLGAVKNRLYTNTKLYFEPMKSLGMGEFYTDGADTKQYPLDISMGFRLHVSSDIADDEDMMESMRESIIKLIDDHMASGSTNLAAIAQLILDNNSDTIRYVDVLGISDTSDSSELNPDLQTMRCVDSEVRPHLKHTLKLLDDMSTIDIDRGLTLEFVVADV